MLNGSLGVRRHPRNQAILQGARFVHIVAISQMTDSDEDGVFEQAIRNLDPEWRASLAFGPHLVRERLQNAEM